MPSSDLPEPAPPPASPEMISGDGRTVRPGEGDRSGRPWFGEWTALFRSGQGPAVAPAFSVRTIDLLTSVELLALLFLIAHDIARQRAFMVAPLALVQGLLLVVLLLNRRGQPVAAARLFCFGNWVVVSLFLLTQELGPGHSALLGFPVLLVLAGLLLDRWFFGALVGLVTLTLFGAAWAEMRGWSGMGQATPELATVAGMAGTLGVLGFTTLAVVLFTADIRRTLQRARDHELKLAASKAELQHQADGLKGATQKLRTAMELAAEAIVHASPEGRITEANSRAAEITGYRHEELIGRSFTGFFSEAELATNPLRWEVSERGEPVAVERSLIRSDGSSILVEMTSQRLPDRTLQCFLRDITSRRVQEDDRRQRQRLESLGTLAGGVAHDFNNLLTVMHGALDAIEARSETPRTMAGPLQDLRTVAERANELTRQLLAFARRQTLDRRPVDLRQTIDQNARMLRRLLGPQIELAIETPEHPCPVFADAGALTQVITNLAVNARDAMPRGGRLKLGCRLVEVTATPSFVGRDIQGGDFVRVHVVDNGCGMPEEVRSRVFDPFFTTKDKDKGTGLGLSVSLGIVEQHGGWIEVFSEVGRGTEFRVFLPRQEPLAQAVPAPPPMPTPRVRGTETILLVEDEDSVRRLAIGALEWSGFKLIEAANGVEALRVWAERRADIQLILTDVAMPGGVSGVDLAQACRRDRPDVPILITSGYNQEEVAFGDGCWDDIRFLPKPYTMAALAQAARETIDTMPRSPAKTA